MKVRGNSVIVLAGMMLVFASAVGADDRILREGGLSETEYPHQEIIEEERDSAYERSYRQGVVDSQGETGVAPGDLFKEGYSDAAKDAM